MKTKGPLMLLAAICFVSFLFPQTADELIVQADQLIQEMKDMDTAKEAEALYEVREILEVGTVEKAFKKMTPAKLKEVEKRKREYRKAITNQVQRKMFVLDTAFHAGIIEMVENPTLTERYWDICQKIFLRFRVEDLKVERIRDITKEHQELFEAVKAKDADLTKELIRSHHSRSRENLFAIIFKNEKENVKLTESSPPENWAI